jgi:hypothetical protein
MQAMIAGKGHKGVRYATKDNLEAVVNELIEGDDECERTAARMVKVMAPMIEEVVTSGDIKQLSGFVRGMANIAASLLLSMPPEMRAGICNALLADLERVTKLARPDGADHD